MSGSESAEAVDPDRWLTPGVASVAAASFFSDSGHEIATSLLPSFLTSTLNAGPAALGTIEGVSDALVGLSKLVGGPLAADPQRRARIASGGYLTTGIATAAIGLATAVWQVALLRALAWMSRGLRSPARDMVLTSITPRRAYGRAFGLERAGDNAGAIVGPLLASLLVLLVGVRHAMLFAVIPGFLAAVAITVAARQARTSLTSPGARQRLGFHLRELRAAGIVGVLAPLAAFELGNLATTLLILRATDLLELPPSAMSGSAAVSAAILLYAGHNVAATAASPLGGRWADSWGSRRVFIGAAGCYVVAYVLLATSDRGWWELLLAFLLAGFGIGLGETVESTILARQLPDRLRAHGFGVLGLVQSLGDVGASLVAGVLWAVVSPTAAFLYAAVWMAVAVVAGIRQVPHGV